MKRTLKFVLPPAVLVVAALGTVVMIKLRPKIDPVPVEIPAPLVRTVALEKRDHLFRVDAQGSVSARTEINLVAEVPGRVVSVSSAFVDGGFFAAGDRLIQIDTRDYALAQTRAQATLAEAQVRLQREEAEAKIAREEWDRLGKGEPSPLLLREPQLAEAEALVKSAEANLQIAELDLERCEVLAPFAGRVRAKQVDLGQFLNKGEVIARIYAVDYAEVRLPLPLDEVMHLDLPMHYQGEDPTPSGSQVILRARFGPYRPEWEGVVVRTEGEIDPRTRMLTAVVRVDNPYARKDNRDRPPLAVGLFVDAEIVGRTVEGVYLAPRSAFRDDQRLMVVDPEERLRFREVERLRAEGDQVVFRAELQDGDRACVSPLQTAVDGMKVRVEPPLGSQP